MSNHASDVAHSALNRLFIACRDEAIGLVAGAIAPKAGSRSLQQTPRKVVLRVQHGAGRIRLPGFAVELESLETGAPRGDSSEKLALQIWSDDGGLASESNDDSSADFVAPLDWRRRRGGFRRVALLASRA